MEDEARELVQAYLDSGASEPFTISFTVRGSNDVIVVAVGRIPSYRQERAVKSLQENLRFIPMPSGSRCPTCGGTGRV